MKNTIKKAMLLILITAFISPVTFSQRGEGWKLNRLESKLNLTDTQKDQVEKLRLDHQKSMIDLKAKLDKAKIESRELMNKGDFNRSDYLAVYNKVSKIREEIQLSALNHRMDVLELMNKDQRKILTEERKIGKRQKKFQKKGRGECNFDACPFGGPRFRNRMRNNW